MGPGKSLVTSVTYNFSVYFIENIEKIQSVGKGDGGEELDVDERELKLYLANTMEKDGFKEEVWQ